MADNIIQRDAKGHFLPGYSPVHGARHTKGTRLTDLVKQRLSDDIEVYVDKTITRVQRKQIMAECMAQLISTAEIKFPDRPGENGKIIEGKTFKYNSGEYMRQLIRVLRYIEPPVQELVVMPGVPDGIVFDNEFSDDAYAEPRELGEELE